MIEKNKKVILQIHLQEGFKEKFKIACLLKKISPTHIINVFIKRYVEEHKARGENEFCLNYGSSKKRKNNYDEQNEIMSIRLDKNLHKELTEIRKFYNFTASSIVSSFIQDYIKYIERNFSENNEAFIKSSTFFSDAI